MKQVLSLAVLVAALGVCSIGVAQSNAGPLFAISIRPSKEEFKVGQHIIIVATLTNNSDREVVLGDSGVDLDYPLDVRDADGNPVAETERLQKLKHPSATDIMTLAAHPKHIKPHESKEKSIMVDSDYNLSRPGKYTIQVQREYPLELGPGIAKSNTITVTVTP